MYTSALFITFLYAGNISKIYFGENSGWFKAEISKNDHR